MTTLLILLACLILAPVAFVAGVWIAYKVVTYYVRKKLDGIDHDPNIL